MRPSKRSGSMARSIAGTSRRRHCSGALFPADLVDGSEFSWIDSFGGDENEKPTRGISREFDVQDHHAIGAFIGQSWGIVKRDAVKKGVNNRGAYVRRAGLFPQFCMDLEIRAPAIF